MAVLSLLPQRSIWLRLMAGTKYLFILIVTIYMFA